MTRPPPVSTLFPYTTLFRSLLLQRPRSVGHAAQPPRAQFEHTLPLRLLFLPEEPPPRSEEHTSELQSRFDLVCRLLLEKKNKQPAHQLIVHQPPPPKHHCTA